MFHWRIEFSCRKNRPARRRREHIELEYNKPIRVESKLIVEILKNIARSASNRFEASGRKTNRKSRRVFDETDGKKENECCDPVLKTNRIVHLTLFPIHGFLLPVWQTTTSPLVP